jgi:NADH:ubiquinone oxidoreductase subunit H
MYFKISAVSFPVALAFLCGWLAMLATQNGNDAYDWGAFWFVLIIAIIFHATWLAME